MRSPLSLALGALLGVAQVAASAAGLGGGEPLGNAGLAGHESFGTQRIIARVAEAEIWPDLVARLTPLGVELDAIVTRNPLRVVLRARSGSAADASRLASLLAASGRFDYALQETFRPMELRGRYVPNDPLFAEQWALANSGQGGRGRGGADVGATTAWRYTLGSPAITIAVLDDGVQLDHPDLAANIIDAGRDFTVYPSVAGAGPRAAADRHGTSVAGIAAARGDNEIGVSGMCPRCTILPIRVHGSSNLGTAAAFRYAVEQGADVITNSWGYTRGAAAADDAVRDAIDAAARSGRGGRGALVVFGMTNENVDNCGPQADIASLDSVVAVGVANHNDQIGGSGFGACMDLVAPAKPKDRGTIGNTTTDRTGIDGHTAGDYTSAFGGTSAAAPLVAGVAGLLLSLNSDLRREDLQRILEHTAEKIDPAAAAYDATGFSAHAGYGRVSAARALVPTVTIRVNPARVERGEPFSVTVSASAPFGLESVSWRGRATGTDVLDAVHTRTLGGAAIETLTWSSLTIETPGTYVFEADARDARHAQPVPGYPHRASDAAGLSLAELTVVERSAGVSR